MAIRVQGTISISRKKGRRGDFNIGHLTTEIGEFEVKDSLIEEFAEGKYSGAFLIQWIEPDSFAWRGSVFVKNKATLAEILIDDADEHAAPPAPPPEPDPLERETAAALQSAAPDQAPAATPTTPADTSGTGAQQPCGDSASQAAARGSAAEAAVLTHPADDLFPPEIASQIAQRQMVKLDPTVDRQVFRRQRDALRDVGYAFDPKSQTWVPPALAAVASGDDLCF